MCSPKYRAMKPTDFSRYLSEYLLSYLPGERGVSPNTILSYKDMFLLLITFMQTEQAIPAERLELKSITKDVIVAYLDWLQSKRHCSNSTRNSRLAAIHSFFRYLQYQKVDNILECQRILSIPLKKTKKTIVTYLSIEGIRLLLKEPDLSTTKGRRDLALLALLYDSGARVQEIIDLVPSRLKFDSPCTVKLIGKGNKTRIVPLMPSQMKFVKIYMSEHNLNEPSMNMHPLFYNSRKEKMTRAGINYILMKYAKMARDNQPTLIPDNLSCHSLRHSKAMHLLQSGVNLVYIRDILGHASIQTTEIYAKVESRNKREALEKAYTEVSPKGTPIWLKQNNVLSWLQQFSA